MPRQRHPLAAGIPFGTTTTPVEGLVFDVEYGGDYVRLTTGPTAAPRAVPLGREAQLVLIFLLLTFGLTVRYLPKRLSGSRC